MSKAVLIYGGKGALGSHLVQFFKNKGFHVGSIDFVANESADYNILLQNSLNLEEQGECVKNGVPEGLKLDAVVCVAGGWAGGSAASKDFLKNSNLMMQQSLWTSLIASSVAAKCLKEEGTLVLTGAQPALSPTPGMIGYGVAKAAVHQLTRSVGSDKGGLPKGSKALAILPVTLDTPMNRKFMKVDDTWTPLEDVANILHNWITSPESPPSGSLVQLITKGGKTETVIE
jgi:NAD(P)-dependent dehydrogenase (short-subunit alcohol dehydrogenase family)